MKDKELYKVAVVEVRRKVVRVYARSEQEAMQRVNDGWLNGELLLTDEDFNGLETCILAHDAQESGLDKIESKM